ncbi:MAG: sulfotransferase [Chloroflexi bacterium]|nr:sulfotransferase [Chloroflexota bacterium]
MVDKYNSFEGQIRRINGAWRSGSPAARLGMMLKAIKPFANLLDKVFSLSFSIVDNEKEIPACLLIVGPPRSGSTIIYQVLARAIPSVYISNIHSIFPRGASRYMLKNNLFSVNLGGFHNYYGHTASIRDVNEGNEFIDDIFRGTPTPGQIRQRFISFVRNMQAIEGRPLIFKNASAYWRLACLHEAVPEVVFLRVQRDPEQIVQSVVRAYHELGGFNPIPEALLNSDITDPVEFAVRQVMEIERVIDAQKKHIVSKSWVEFAYEDFCRDPWPVIEDLAVNRLGIDLVRLRRNAVPELQVSTRSKVSQDDARKIRSLLQHYSEIDAYRNGL